MLRQRIHVTHTDRIKIMLKKTEKNQNGLDNREKCVKLNYLRYSIFKVEK